VSTLLGQCPACDGPFRVKWNPEPGSRIVEVECPDCGADCVFDHDDLTPIVTSATVTRAPLADVLRDVAATINADPSPEGLARTERECMEALFPDSTRPPLPPVAPGASAPRPIDEVEVRKALDARWALLLRCRDLIGSIHAVECGGKLASGHYVLRDRGLYDVAALLVAIDLEGETADPLTGERPAPPSELPSMPVEVPPRSSVLIEDDVVVDEGDAP
jgi:hypothetical protein